MATHLISTGRRLALLTLAGSVALFALGATKNPSSEPVEAAPVVEFVPKGGVFTQAISLRLAAKTPGSVIRYTLDGSEPTERSPSFAKAVELGASTIVRARAYDGSKRGGVVTAQTYTVLADDLRAFTSNLPLVIINTFGTAIEHTTRQRGSVRFIEVAGGRSSLLGAADFEGRADLWHRGKSSLRYVKRSYGLKVRDESSKPQSVSVLGFPKDSDWILYAPYPDKTLLRDVLAYELSNQMGHYASRTRFVEVFVNEGVGRLSQRHYMGVFVLEEKVKRGTNRVNLAKLGTNDNAEPNITGGYLFKKDHLDENREVEPTWDGRPNFGGGNSGSRYGYPTGPGGFPADPRGFLPPAGGSRANTRGWEDTGNATPAAEPPRAQGKSWIDDLRSLLGGGNSQSQPPPPAPENRSRTIRRSEENNPPPGNPLAPPDGIERSRRGGREPVIIWDTPNGRAFFGGESGGRAFEEAFYTQQRNEFIYVEPEANEMTSAQKNWLRGHLNEFERVLHGPNFRDPAKGYAAYIDVGSFIDHHLMVEVTKNIDGFRFSTYYAKDRGGKLRMEPIWDWNLSFGNANGKQGHIAEYWYWPQLGDAQYAWFRRLFDDPDFGQRYVDRYAETRAGVFSLSNINARIDRHVAELGAAQVRNFKRWPILGRRVWPNTFVGDSYEEEIAYMKEFISKRLTWMDRQFVAAPAITVSAGPDGASGLISLSSSAPKIYYTLDGTDPRVSGGGVSPKAQVAAGSIKLLAGARLFARAQQDSRWSAPVRR